MQRFFCPFNRPRDPANRLCRGVLRTPLRPPPARGIITHVGMRVGAENLPPLQTTQMNISSSNDRGRTSRPWAFYPPPLSLCIFPRQTHRHGDKLQIRFIKFHVIPLIHQFQRIDYGKIIKLFFKFAAFQDMPYIIIYKYNIIIVFILF